MKKSAVSDFFSRIDLITLLHVLAGVSLGISLSMAPSPWEAGSASTLIIIAVIALLEAMIARRGRAADVDENEAPEQEPPYLILLAYCIFVGCLISFFQVVRLLQTGGFYLWIFCSLFAFCTWLWRDLSILHSYRKTSVSQWNSSRFVIITTGLASGLYYLVYGFAGVSNVGFPVFFAALFHLFTLVFRNLLDGPLESWFTEPDERELEKILMGYYGEVQPADTSQTSTIAAIIESIVDDGEERPAGEDVDDSASDEDVDDSAKDGEERATCEASEDSAKDGSESASDEDVADESVDGSVEEDEDGAKDVNTDDSSDDGTDTDRDEADDRSDEDASLHKDDVSKNAEVVTCDNSVVLSEDGKPLSEDEFNLFASALEAMEDGREEVALHTLLELVLKRPELEEPTIQAAQLAARHNMADQGRLLLMEFLKKNPSSYGAFFQLGRILKSEGKRTHAVRAFIRCSQIIPSAVSPLRELANIAMEDDGPQKALSYVKKALTIDKRNAWATNMRSQIESIATEKKVASLREETRSLLARQEKGKALAAFKQLAALEPSDLQSRLISARVLLENGSTDEAVNIFEQALSVPFEGREGMSLPVDLARAYCSAGEYEKALKELSHSRLHFPWSIDLAMLYIDVLLRLSKGEEAVKVAETADATACPEARIISALSLLKVEGYVDTTPNDVDERVQKLLEGINLLELPSIPYESAEKVQARFYEAKGLLLSRRGNLKEAEEAFEKAVSLDPASVSVRGILADIRMANGESSRALVHYEALRTIEPENYKWKKALIETLVLEASARHQEDSYLNTILTERKRLLMENAEDTAVLYETAMTILKFDGLHSSVISGATPGHYLKMALKNEPHNEWIADALAEYYATMKNDQKKGRDLLKSKAEYSGATADTWALYGNYLLAHAGQGQADDIEKAFRKCLDMSPTCADALYGLGSHLFVAGKQDEAIDVFKKALRYAPYHKDSDRAREIAGM